MQEGTVWKANRYTTRRNNFSSIASSPKDIHLSSHGFNEVRSKSTPSTAPFPIRSTRPDIQYPKDRATDPIRWGSIDLSSLVSKRYTCGCGRHRLSRSGEKGRMDGKRMEEEEEEGDEGPARRTEAIKMPCGQSRLVITRWLLNK